LTEEEIRERMRGNLSLRRVRASTVILGVIWTRTTTVDIRAFSDLDFG
jgi:hypothetical protein